LWKTLFLQPLIGFGAVAQSVEQRTENPCVGGSIPPHTTESPGDCRGFFMFIVYILYSPLSGKTYVGYTANLDRRMLEHNVTETQGYTLRYRPWELIHSEIFQTKKEAMEREKFLKTGRGREFIKKVVGDYLNSKKG
jgi:putative endonuclease